MNMFKKYNLIGGWLCFAIATLCYLLTMEPTTSLWDCAEFIATSYKLEIGPPPGAPLFMMIARFFMIFGGPEQAGLLANTMSSLASGLTILFLFWTITLLALKWFGKKSSELSTGEIWAVIGAGAVGALAYAFTDTFWFSGVEGEVYALSSFFTAIVFWAMLRWEQVADEPHANRWLVLIAYLMGLSIGVHLLNLLAFPAMIFIYYFKKYPKITQRGVLGATAISVAVVFFVLKIICPWTIKLGAWTDLLFVNSFGLPVNSGMATYAILLFALLGLGVWYTYKKRKIVWNTFMLMTTVIVLGYGSYAYVIIRSAANPPMNSNDPSNPFGLMMLLSRDQYGGDKPLVSGQTYASPVNGIKWKTYYYINEEGRYVPYDIVKGYTYAPGFNMFFSRMHDQSSEAAYKEWVDITGQKMLHDGEVRTVPTFGENLQFFFRYQFNFMYWRYFMWNFVGRQNDEQADGGITKGNWLSGIDFIDEMFYGPQDNLPDEMANNKGRNRYYFLPFILGLLGILTQLKRDGRGFTVVMWLFFMTGIAIILYLNQTPGEPRERDYAYAGSFYAFAIWIGIGVLWVYEALLKAAKKQPLAAGVATVLCLSVPVILCTQNWDDHDRSHRTIARDIGYDYLETLLPNAIVMNYGDNDTFPLWYNQEVENVRPDVRIMNLSYLGGEWYVDQMKIKVNDSEAVPFTLPQEFYYGGRGTQIYIEDQMGGQALPAKDLVRGIVAKHPATRGRLSDGSEVAVIPTKTLLLPVNKANAVAAGILRPEEAAQALDTIRFTLPGDYLSRPDMLLLDLIANFDWKRPLYFTQPNNLRELGLMDYLQQDGLAYRLVPFKTAYEFHNAGRIDTKYLYDNLMKYRYGNIRNPRVYADYFTRYTVSATQLRGTTARLANQLIRQGDTIHAQAVLDRIVEEIPFSQVPHNYPFSNYLIEAYYHAGNVEKANALLDEYATSLKQYISWFMQFPPAKQELIFRDLQEDAALLSILASLAERFGQQAKAGEIDAFLDALGI